MGEKQKGKTEKWRRWMTAAGLAVSAAVLVWLLWYAQSQVDWRRLLTEIHPVWLLCAALAIPVLETVDMLIFYSMGRRSGENVRLGRCFDATFIGELYYRLGLPGAPMQLGLLLDAGFSPTAAAGVYTWKSLAHTGAYALFALAALGCKLGLWGERLGWLLPPILLTLTGYGALCALGLWAVKRPDRTAALVRRFFAFWTKKFRWLQRDRRGERAGEKGAEYCAALGRMGTNRELLWRVLLGVFVELLLLFSVPAYLYCGLGLRGASFLQVTLTTSLVMLLARLVALPGNAVGAEGSFYLLLAPYFGGYTAVALLLWRLLTFAWPMLLGAAVSLFRAGAGRFGKERGAAGPGQREVVTNDNDPFATRKNKEFFYHFPQK